MHITFREETIDLNFFIAGDEFCFHIMDCCFITSVLSVRASCLQISRENNLASQIFYVFNTHRNYVLQCVLSIDSSHDAYVNKYTQTGIIIAKSERIKIICMTIYTTHLGYMNKIMFHFKNLT